MKKNKKMFEEFLNSASSDRDSEEWIIGGKNRYCRRDNWGTMLKRYDPIAFNMAYMEWREEE